MNEDYRKVEDSINDHEETSPDKKLRDVKSVENICLICSKVFSVSSNLKRHMRRIHETENTVRKSNSCNLCEYKCRDKYQLKVHMRSHTKERPYSCSLCNFKSSKKEDCKRHMSTCKGPKFKCVNCQEAFKSRSAVNEHHIWDRVCGTLASEERDTLVEETEGGGDKSIVKIIISKDMSVVGVNCNQLLDEEVFEKRSRRTRCGLCFNCTLTENCGKCKVCMNFSKTSSKQLCLKRSCNKPIELFELKKDHVTFHSLEGMESCKDVTPKDEIVATTNADVAVPEIEFTIKNDILIDGPVDMFNGMETDFLGQDAGLAGSMYDSCNQTSSSNSCILLHEDVLQL